MQLHNQLQVPCKWFITMNEPVKKVEHRPRVTRHLLAGFSLPFLPLLPLWLLKHLGDSSFEEAFEGIEQRWFTWTCSLADTLLLCHLCLCFLLPEEFSSHLPALPIFFLSSSRPVVVTSGLAVGGLGTETVSPSTAGTEGLSLQTKEISHSCFLCLDGQTFASERASEAPAGVEGQALCL